MALFPRQPTKTWFTEPRCSRHGPSKRRKVMGFPGNVAGDRHRSVGLRREFAMTQCWTNTLSSWDELGALPEENVLQTRVEPQPREILAVVNSGREPPGRVARAAPRTQRAFLGCPRRHPHRDLAGSSPLPGTRVHRAPSTGPSPLDPCVGVCASFTVAPGLFRALSTRPGRPRPSSPLGVPIRQTLEGRQVNR